MRLIDLHVDWLLQYAPESTAFDSSLYPGAADRIGQSEGYLQATRAAVVSCYRDAREWENRPDAWAALAELIARIEAEFAGRLLIGPDDFYRWEDDADGLAWGVIGVEGFDALIRSEADLAHLPRLFDRGVRLFQPTYTASGLLGGSATPGDDRGLTELGRALPRPPGRPRERRPRPPADLRPRPPQPARLVPGPGLVRGRRRPSPPGPPRLQPRSPGPSRLRRPEGAAARPPGPAAGPRRHDRDRRLAPLLPVA